MARTGLRMMPTFPSPSLRFRTVGFPQYGSKAGLSDGTFLQPLEVKPAPGMPSPVYSLSPSFACALRRETSRYCAQLCRRGRMPPFEKPALLYPRGPQLRASYVVLPILAYTTPCASPTGTLRLRGIALIRSAFAVRERLGDPRDLPYFCCHSFHTCHRPYPGRPPTLPSRFIVSGSRLPRSWSESPLTNLRLCQQYLTGPLFRGCIVHFMVRPVCLPSPPDWLRLDEVTCSSPGLLRYIVTSAFDAARSRVALEVRLNGRTGNLPLLGLSPNQLWQPVRLHPRRQDNTQ